MSGLLPSTAELEVQGHDIQVFELMDGFFVLIEPSYWSESFVVLRLDRNSLLDFGFLSTGVFFVASFFIAFSVALIGKQSMKSTLMVAWRIATEEAVETWSPIHSASSSSLHSGCPISISVSFARGVDWIHCFRAVLNTMEQGGFFSQS